MAAVSDHDQIRSTLARYCQHCDDGRFDAFADLFTDDATFTVMGTTQTGRQQIATWMAEVQPPEARGKHVISEPFIELDGDSARAATDYLFVGRTHDGLAVTSTGRYLDELRRGPGGWQIAAREIVFLGDDPPA